MPLALLALPAAAGAWGTTFAPMAHNPANKLVKKPIDGYRYDYAKRCLKHPRKGTKALEAWLGRHAGGVSWGMMRCEKWGRNSASLHAEGRALDWHLDVHKRSDRREAQRIISLMLAPDRAGNVHALARRMGIQEIIWNCRAWYTGDGGLQRYSVCFDGKGRRKRGVDDTTAHRNHIHFGVNWAGARMKTSFWTH